MERLGSRILRSTLESFFDEGEFDSRFQIKGITHLIHGLYYIALFNSQRFLFFVIDLC